MSTTLRRRALVGGIAWSVPAVASVMAAPAFAASGCYSVSVTGFAYISGDLLVLKNAGTTTIPAGTVISWKVQNVSGNTRTYTINSLSGVTLTSGNSPVSVPNNSAVTFKFTLNAALAPGGTVQWNLTTGSSNGSTYKYNSSIIVGSAGCAAVCFSDTGLNTFSNVCAPAAAAMVQSRSTGVATSAAKASSTAIDQVPRTAI